MKMREEKRESVRGVTDSEDKATERSEMEERL